MKHLSHTNRLSLLALAVLVVFLIYSFFLLPIPSALSDLLNVHSNMSSNIRANIIYLGIELEGRECNHVFKTIAVMNLAHRNNAIPCYKGDVNPAFSIVQLDNQVPIVRCPHDAVFYKNFDYSGIKKELNQPQPTTPMILLESTLITKYYHQPCTYLSNDARWNDVQNKLNIKEPVQAQALKYIQQQTIAPTSTLNPKNRRVTLVGVHVLEGDDLNKAYFKSAMFYLRKKYSTKKNIVKFLIASNDSSWYQKQSYTTLDHNVVIIYDPSHSHRHPHKAEFELAILANCDHVILDLRDSFSWWVGFLSLGDVIYNPNDLDMESNLRSNTEWIQPILYPSKWIPMQKKQGKHMDIDILTEYSSGITREHIIYTDSDTEEGVEVQQRCTRYAIIANTLIDCRNFDFPGQKDQFERSLRIALAREQMDDFMFNYCVEDYAMFRRNDWKKTLVVAAADHPTMWDIAIPEFDFIGTEEEWPPTGSDWYQKRTAMLKAGYEIQWEKKINTIFFRGSFTGRSLPDLGGAPFIDDPTTNPRFFPTSLNACGMEHTPLGVGIDLQLTNSYDVKDSTLKTLMCKTTKPWGNKITMEDHCKYKYLLSCSGRGTQGHRLKQLMACGSVVFMHTSQHKESWYNLVVPWVHVIPYAEDSSDLLEKIDWAHTHPEEAQKIAENGRKLIEEQITDQYMVDFWKNYSTEFNKLKTFETADIRAMCSMTSESEWHLNNLDTTTTTKDTVISTVVMLLIVLLLLLFCSYKAYVVKCASTIR